MHWIAEHLRFEQDLLVVGRGDQVAGPVDPRAPLAPLVVVAVVVEVDDVQITALRACESSHHSMLSKSVHYAVCFDARIVSH